MRQFISSSQPDKKGVLQLRGKDYHYLAGVLRISAGEMLEVRFPSGELLLMAVDTIGKKEMTLIRAAQRYETVKNKGFETGVLASEISGEILSKLPEIWLLQFLVKPQKMDDIIRQSTECGVSAIIPVVGDFTASSVQSSTARMDRWERIIREARQQSGSPVSTRISEPCSIEKAVSMWESSSGEKKGAFVLSEKASNGGDRSLFSLLSEKKTSACLAVGSEGGLSQFEMEYLDKKGFTRLHFSTNILRAETAALYGIAVLQNALSEFESWYTSE